MKTLRRRGGLLLAALTIVLAGAACIPPTAPWRALDTGPAAGQTGWTPEAPMNPSANSTIVSNRVVDLIWLPGQPNSYLGTSVETDNLGLTVSGDDTLSVTYGLSSSTVPETDMDDGDAVRMFVYFQPKTDGLGAPDLVASPTQSGTVDCVTSCQLSVDVPPGTHTIGYMGLVYDTSNGGDRGRVRFRDLQRNDQLILFR